jgi:ArsR family transcriptional regulator
MVFANSRSKISCGETAMKNPYLGRSTGFVGPATDYVEGFAESRRPSRIVEINVDRRGRLRHLISMELEQAAKQLEALGNPTRLQVYRTLVRAGDAGLPVGQLQDKIGIAASTLSHHLHRLILTGLVTQERQATTLICRANYPMMDALIGFLADECCADAARASVDDEAAA